MYRCAVIMSEGGSIWELYHGCYLGYKPNQDIHFSYTPIYKFFYKRCTWNIYTSYILSNLISQNVQAMVQIIRTNCHDG